jgi:hypothetical protein
VERLRTDPQAGAKHPKWIGRCSSDAHGRRMPELSPRRGIITFLLLDDRKTMPIDTDTNQLAFDKLKALTDADTTLPEPVKKAVADACAATTPTVDALRKWAEDDHASAK